MTSGLSREVSNLPSARGLIGRAFDLDIRSSGDLRDASLFMASQFLLIVGPVAVVLAVLFIRLPEFMDVLDPALLDPASFEDLPLPNVEFFTQVMLGMLLAVLGVIAISIESQIIAITVLAGRLVGRPVTLRQAVARSRRAFWRMVRASILVGIPAAIAGAILEGTVGRVIDPLSEGYTILALGVGVLVAIPFAYVPTAIVIGDVGARESIVRGYRLVRAHRSVAVVIALFTAAAQFLQLFALGAGGDIVVRVGGALGLGFDQGDGTAALTYGLIMVSILAVGTLLFTTIAIAAAPQVVAFVALTNVQTGLDRILGLVAEVVPPTESEPAVVSQSAGEPEPDTSPGTEVVPVPPRTHWDQVPAESTSHRLISIPMAIGGVLAIVVALAAIDGMSRLS